MIIAFDFDGTVVTNAWPEIGEPVPFAVETLKKFRADGHTLILNTCREGELLQNALDYLDAAGIQPDFVNSNPEANARWGKCRKVWADMYIDDHNAFARLRDDGSVDWLWIKRQYENRGPSDVVKRPSHYQGAGGLQAIDVIEAFGLQGNKWQAAKYILRAGKKEKNSELQDLKKAAFYINREIENVENGQG